MSGGSIRRTDDGALHTSIQEDPAVEGGQSKIEMSILMPCLNEAETIGTCIAKAQQFLKESNVNGEIVVADNGSKDGSPDIARRAGARVINVDRRGYGSALRAAIGGSRGKFAIMGDADNSYDFSALMPFLSELRSGNDLVMGNRFSGQILPGAMPPLHRYVGNPILSWIGRRLFDFQVGDVHCGLRGFRRDSILALDLQTDGMEFASEMVVRARLRDLRITEVPVVLSPDGRSRRPHLRTWRDGWRHLRFLLLYCPRWLFFLPGFILIMLGLILGVPTALSTVKIGRVSFDVNTLAVAATAFIVGVQAMQFALLAYLHGTKLHIFPLNRRIEWLLRALTLERVLVVAALVFLCGVIGLADSVLAWRHVRFGALNARREIRLVLCSSTAVIVASQIAFGRWLISFLQ
jgi:glycosyltransferase involved in cell wall biosynthesis